MENAAGRLTAIEAFLQREDDELLYAPDGSPLGGSVGQAREELEARLSAVLARATPAVYALEAALRRASQAVAALAGQSSEPPDGGLTEEGPYGLQGH